MSRSFAITIRPKNGLSRKTEIEVLKFLEKQHHAFAVLEGEDEARHLHGQIWFSVEKTKGDLNKSLERICERTIEDWTPAQKVVLRGGTKYAYNDDFVENYCQKEDNPKIVYNNPPSATDEYYPSQEEQQKIKDSSNAVDKRFHRWLQDFKESKYWLNEEWTPTIIDCGRFLSYKMFHTKEYPVIVEKRKRVEYTKGLYMYANSSIQAKEFVSCEDWDIYMKVLQEKMDSGTQT